MKIAVAGKGGTGKTTFSGILARILDEEGKNVIAIDADPDMNLHTSLGISELPTPVSKLKELIEERTVMGSGLYRLNPKVNDVLDNFSIKKNKIRLLVMGTVETGGSGCVCPESTFLRALLRHLILKEEDWVILDMEAGIEHLGRRTAENVDLMVVIVEPGQRSIDTANRIKELSKGIGIKNIAAVANKITHDEQIEFIKSSIDMPLLGSIPYDENIVNADIQGKSPYDLNKNSISVESIKAILRSIGG
ncbi:MAG: AAA family ATPase [Candidatus Hydrothermarchaeota archaeon]